MSRPATSGEEPGADGVTLTDEERRRLRERIFGETLPGATRDDVPGGDERGTNDDWLRSNVPPHHG